MRNHWLDMNDKWYVKIEESERHLIGVRLYIWLDKWLVTGWYEDEKKDYYREEAKWNKARQEEWEREYPDGWQPTVLDDGSVNLSFSEDYFHWHVISWSWSLHADGSWQKMLVNDKNEFTGVYDSREAAETALKIAQPIPPRLGMTYAEFLKKYPC